MIRYDDTRHIFIPEGMQKNGIEAVFGTRFDSSAQHIITARQVHGTVILHADHPDAHPGAGDALITSKSGMRIGVRTADCVPVLYADIQRGVVAASHQGWKGTLEGMAGKVVDTLVSEGCRIKDLRIAIGPAVGACCYRMYGERKSAFERQFPSFVSACIRYSEGTSYLDLARLNYLQLIAMGVPSTQIDRSVYCTACDGNRFFSYQREGAGCGHMISYIMKKGTPI